MSETLETISVVMALALAAVWLVSAVAKALTPAQTATAADALGVPAPVARITPVALPLAEVALAVGLIVPGLRQIAAIGSLLLLGVFTGLILRLLMSGKAAGCNCFGALSHSTLSRRDLVRNGILVLLALPAAAGVDGTVPFAADGSQVVGGVIVVLVVTVALFALSLVMGVLAPHLGTPRRRTRRPADRVSTPPPAPAMAVEAASDLDGFRELSNQYLAVLERYLLETPTTLVIFGRTGCVDCQETLGVRLGPWSELCGPGLGMVVLLHGSDDGAARIQPAVFRAGIPVIEAQSDPGTVELPTPLSGLLMGSDGAILSGPHLGADEIEEALRRARPGERRPEPSQG
jgi:hypothetical protein